MSKDKSQNFTEISRVVPELELFLACNELFKKCKKFFGLILFSKAESCQSFICHFTLKIPAGTNVISYLSVTLLLLLATPHRKSSRAIFFLFLVSISREQKEVFQQKFVHFLIILKNINLGLYALGPQN